MKPKKINIAQVNHCSIPQKSTDNIQEYSRQNSKMLGQTWEKLNKISILAACSDLSKEITPILYTFFGL